MSDLTELVSTPAVEEAFKLLRAGKAGERQRLHNEAHVEAGHPDWDVTDSRDRARGVRRLACAQCPALRVESCAVDGHDPIDVTPLSSLTFQYVCSRCSERWEEDR